MTKNSIKIIYRRSSQLGFTIVELATVISVIGILAAVTTVAYNGAQQRARDASILSDIDAMDTAQTAYQIRNNSGGLAYNSTTHGTSTVLDFSPTPGNKIDVVVGGNDYCIRGYNVKANKNTITNSFKIESQKGVCAILPPSGGA